MITIKEDLTKNCPGITSLFITFTYRPELVNVLHNFSGSFFNKKDCYWEVSIGYLADLLDAFIEYDDIELFLKEDKENKDKIYQIKPIKTKLFSYQETAVQYGLNHDKWLLLDGMGLGKTLQSISLAYNLKYYQKIKHCLIICGVNAVKSNWINEIHKHSDLSCKILGERINTKGKKIIGSITDRYNELKNGIDEFFIITNIETLRDDNIIKELTSKHAKTKIDMVIIDEIHHCKSPTSIQGKHLLKLKDIKYKLGLTGTLLMNDPLDCYVPLKWIGAEQSNYTQYKYNYIIFGGPFNNIPCGYRNLNILKYQLSRYSLRRTSDEVLDLPERTIIPQYIDMDDRQAKFYTDIKNGILKDVDKVKINTATLLAMVTRLRQATVLPSILSSENIPSTKIDMACDMIEQITSQGNKVVLFSTYKTLVLDELDKRLSNIKHIICRDKDNATDIANMFENNPDIKVFIGTWEKCGTGINLISASYMIFLDTPWTWADFDQNMCRIYRIGTKRPVTIYNLICKDTIDERVWQLVNDKGAIADYIIDDKISDNTINSLRQYIIDLE